MPESLGTIERKPAVTPAATDITTVAAVRAPRLRHATDLAARGEPYLWGLGGALALGCLMIVGFLLLVLWNGISTFWPKPIEVVTTTTNERVAGEMFREETYRPAAADLAQLSEAVRARLAGADGLANRALYRTGNYDIYNEDFRWVSDYQIVRRERPSGLFFVERLEWGPFVGTITSFTLDGAAIVFDPSQSARLGAAHSQARDRWSRLRTVERDEIGGINHALEKERLAVRRAELRAGSGSAAHGAAQRNFEERSVALKQRYDTLAVEAQRLRAVDERNKITLAEIGGKEKTVALSSIVRLYPANDIGPLAKIGIYLSRWAEFLTEEPREANTEGGVLPAIFGTFAMTILLAVVVAPFGVMTALYLREYAKQGRMVSIVRISVNNLAGVPSIVYGVFGLGFLAYIVGASIDRTFFPERLPNPTFGTGGLLWASLTLALLTVPVVIVATEEALAAVPRSMREGSLACGASKWQTIRNIVLPRAMPGIMTGLILAMARGAGEVAPLMLVGVVKLAPELPIDGDFPFVHLERSFMHLGFHIYDVGFQSRNSEAGKPMVFVTTLLLIALVAAMNAWAIIVRNRLKRRLGGGQF